MLLFIAEYDFDGIYSVYFSKVVSRNITNMINKQTISSHGIEYELMCSNGPMAQIILGYVYIISSICVEALLLTEQIKAVT